MRDLDQNKNRQSSWQSYVQRYLALFVSWLMLSSCGELKSDEFVLNYDLAQIGPNGQETHDPQQALPMLILVHGSFSKGENALKWFDTLPKTYRIIAPNGPYNLGKGFSWYPNRSDKVVRDAAVWILDLIHNVTSQYPTQGQPVMVGFSQGGVMAYYLGVHHPGALSKAISVAGELKAGLIPHKKHPDQHQVELIALTGTRDSAVPVEWMNFTYDALTKLGIDVKYKTFDGVKHKLAPMKNDLLLLLQ